MATLQGWRRAYGAIKDTTTVGLAHVNSDYKDLDVAIVKATNHVERPPKERHLRKILIATSAIRPRADVMYCIHALSRRLTKTRNWTVALKTLVVLHRTLREGDPTFREELLNVSQKGRILQLSNFKDDSSPIAWDCSGWVRTYALFLEERLECYKILKYDIEAERLPRPVQGTEKGYSRTRDLDSEDLLEHLPALQQLLYRLIGCRPEGAASSNYLIQYALALVLKESFKIYCAINDGIINLVDKFFEMPRHEAIKALEVYRRAGQQAGSLSDFYEVCKGLELARNFQFPVLREPPQSFLLTMEEYIREAPRIVNVMKEPLEFQERLQLTYKPDNSPPPEPTQSSIEPVDSADGVSFPNTASAYPPAKIADTADLLGLDASTSGTSEKEDYNALAIALVPSDNVSSDHGHSFFNDFDSTGWELALVPTSTSSGSSGVDNTQLGGRIDSLTLNSLYDEGTFRAASQQSTIGTTSHQPTNPFDGPDPFSSPALPSNSAQMPTLLPQHSYVPYQQPYIQPQQHQQEMIMSPTGYPLAQQQQQQQQVVMGAPHQLYPPQPQSIQQHMLVRAANPFEDGGAYAGFGGADQSKAMPVQNAPAANPFGNSALL